MLLFFPQHLDESKELEGSRNISVKWSVIRFPRVRIFYHTRTLQKAHVYQRCWRMQEQHLEKQVYMMFATPFFYRALFRAVDTTFVFLFPDVPFFFTIILVLKVCLGLDKCLHFFTCEFPSCNSQYILISFGILFLLLDCFPYKGII